MTKLKARKCQVVAVYVKLFNEIDLTMIHFGSMNQSNIYKYISTAIILFSCKYYWSIIAISHFLFTFSYFISSFWFIDFHLYWWKAFHSLGYFLKFHPPNRDFTLNKTLKCFAIKQVLHINDSIVLNFDITNKRLQFKTRWFPFRVFFFCLLRMFKIDFDRRTTLIIGALFVIE